MRRLLHVRTVAAAWAAALWTAASWAAALGGAGCETQPAALTPDQLLARLEALPGVTVEVGPDSVIDPQTGQPRYHYYTLHFTQPIDHNDPSRGTFQQEVSLLHRDDRAPVPMVVHTSGYHDYYRNSLVELTALLDANQVSIEHRYFGESVPVNPDWSYLTIQQMAADEHDIILALRGIYGGAFLTTGGSKGGSTAVFHRRFYPDDVEGTVAYVAPISYGDQTTEIDGRYAGLLNDIYDPRGIGPADGVCRLAVRALAEEMLKRSDRMVAAAQQQALDMAANPEPGQAPPTYTKIAIGPAVEAAAVSLEWAYWQYFGVAQCGSLPSTTASDGDLFSFLQTVSPVTDDDDAQVELAEPYYYQGATQLAFPDYGTAYLDPYLKYMDTDLSDDELPTPEPVFDGGVAMRDIDDYVERRGDRLMLIYGQWDPWRAGQIVLGDAADSWSYVQPQGTHTSSISTLARADMEAALATLQRWSGVPPHLTQAQVVSIGAASRTAWRVPPALVLAHHPQQ